MDRHKESLFDHDHGTMPPKASTEASPDDPAPFGSPVMDQHVFYSPDAQPLNQLEGRFGDTQSFRWSGEAWAGTDTDRLWLRSEGRLSDGLLSDGQVELFYARPISTYFNLMAGGRYDMDSLPGRGWGALGIEPSSKGSGESCGEVRTVTELVAQYSDQTG